MRRLIGDEHKAAAFTRAFGGEEWRECEQLPEDERRTRLLERYCDALRDPERGGASYVLPFLMFDADNVPLYWLIFCTNHIRGLEEMKRAMWTVDRTGNFRFSDHDTPGQLRLLNDAYDQQWLADELANRLAGRTITCGEVAAFVLTDTPCYLYKQALTSLEKSDRLTALNPPLDRRPGTFPDKQMRVRFEKSLF